jgi:hypothetical protein
MMLSVPAIRLSAALIGVLARRDPKRLRNIESADAAGNPSPLPAQLRSLLGWLVPAPGVVLMILGEWWAFLVWLGALCVLGWVASQTWAIRSADASTASH